MCCRNINPCALAIGIRSSSNVPGGRALSAPSNVGCDRDVDRTLRTNSTGKQGNFGPKWLPRLNRLKLRLRPSWLDNQIWTASLEGAPPHSGAETQPCGILSKGGAEERKRKLKVRKSHRRDR